MEVESKGRDPVKKLRIGKRFSLPLSYVTGTAAILGQKRSGKTYKGSVLAEELLDAAQQIIILDPTSAWWGLRSSSDGRGAGYPITIFGGEHGDLAIDPTAGAELARAIVHERFSAIIDLDGLTKGEEQRFSAAFLETLYRSKTGEYRTPVHLFLDEADVFAPQKPMGLDESKTLGACQSIVRRGGIKGIGITMITQRPAVLNKDVLSQCDTLITLRLSHPKDMAQIDAWVGVHGDPKLAKEMAGQLPSLPRGDAWVWSPMSEIFECVSFRDRSTFDSGKTPETGGHVTPPKVLARVDIDKLGAAIAKSAEEAKANDPKALREQVAALKRDLAKGASSVAHTPSIAEGKKELMRLRTELEAVTVRADKLEARKPLTDKQIKGFAKAVERLAEFGERITNANEAISTIAQTVRNTLGPWAPMPAGRGVAALIPDPKPARSDPYRHPIPKWPPVAPAAAREPSRRSSVPKAPLAAAPATGDALPPGEAKILTALIQFGELTSDNLSTIVGYKKSSRDTYLTRLIGRGYVERSNGILMFTDAGEAALPNAEPLPTGAELRAHWEQKLPPGEWKILKVAIDQHPSVVGREHISEVTGYKKSSRDTYITRLVARKLLRSTRDGIAASPMLFED